MAIPLNNTGITRYCICDLDDFTYVSWLHFAKIKSEMVKYVSDLFEILKIKGIKVEYICCFYSGKHMSELRTLCRKEGI